jgi:hypothetical protein
LIEGEGSFYLNRDPIAVRFAMALTAVQLPVLVKIQEYLKTNLGFDKNSSFKLNSISPIGISHHKAGNKTSKPSVQIIIHNLHILHNFFIPFLEELLFNSKKYQSFLEFKLICRALYKGAHRTPEIRDLILKLSLTMNNYSLSTNPNPPAALRNEELEAIKNAAPTLEHLSDGRIRDIHTKVLIPQSQSCIYEITKASTGTILAATLAEAAQVVGVSRVTLSKYLDVEECNKIVEVKGFNVRRIAVFYNNLNNTKTN